MRRTKSWCSRQLAYTPAGGGCPRSTCCCHSRLMTAGRYAVQGRVSGSTCTWFIAHPSTATRSCQALQHKPQDAVRAYATPQVPPTPTCASMFHRCQGTASQPGKQQKKQDPPSSMRRSSSSSRRRRNTRVPLVADRLTSRPLGVPAMNHGWWVGWGRWGWRVGGSNA